MIMAYIRYCIAWYKQNGLKRKVRAYAYGFIISRNGKNTLPDSYYEFLTPIIWYKERKERQRWINEAIRVRKETNNKSHREYTLSKGSYENKGRSTSKL